MTVVTVPPINLVEEQHTGLVVAQEFDAMVVTADNPATVVISPLVTTPDTAAPWSAYVPTFTFTTSGSTPATFVLNYARWTQIGKTVHFFIDVTMSNVGVGNGVWLVFTLPVPAAASTGVALFGAGHEIAVIGKMVSVTPANTAQAYLVSYDGASVISFGNGARFQLGGTYEAA